MEQIVLEERVSRAVGYFKSGYNCAQSVTAAYADLYGFTLEQSLLMSASFGGGIGRLRETCGAACGMFILAGLETGTTEPGNRTQKGVNYQVVQALAQEFTRRNGALKCATLLRILPNDPPDPIPQERNSTYYVKRPCLKIIECAATIVGEFLIRNRK